jgi:hypothetical protein
MKILLLGEFSGFYTNLKDGLETLGHEVVLASFSDGYKKIKSTDISFDAKASGVLGKIENRIRPLMFLPRLKGFDVVQLINPFVFDFPGFPLMFFLKTIKKQNKKCFLSACGADAFYFQRIGQFLEYTPIPDILKYDFSPNKCKFMTEKALIFNKKIADSMDGVIPISYDHWVGYQDQINLKNTIPMPINYKKIKYTKNLVSGKLVVFHGLTRYGLKGTRFIEEAFEILRKKYPDKIEIVIESNLPLEDYLKVISRANIIVDQASSYSYGMNALYSMAQGKIVMSGLESEALSAFGLASAPVINIKPCADNIVMEIEKILEDLSLVEKIGKETRDFVVNHHDPEKIAKLYVDTWNS